LKPDTILKIDRGLGRPICFALTAVRRIGRLILGRVARELPPIRKVLFIKLIEQGATVLAYRALMTAVERVGRENVYFWVFEENRHILDFVGVVPPENVLVIRNTSFMRLARDMLGTLWRARKLKVDAAVDMEFFSRASAILGFLSGARRRVGLHRFNSEMPYRGDLLTHRVQYNPYHHVAVQYHHLVEALWADPRQTPMLKAPAHRVDGAVYEPPQFQPTEQELASVRGTLEKLSGRPIEGRRLFIINPNTSDLLPLRRWDTDRFVEVGRRLLAAYDDGLLLVTGALNEREGALRVVERVGVPPDRCVCTAGCTTLRELMALYTISDLMVTNDSGPGHFASMTRLPTLVLFGPETPAVFGPLGRHTRILWKNLACSPCVNAMNHRFSPCNNNVCMQLITVDDVCAAADEMLRDRPGAKTGN
jgi:ADP-heptose:LPS heptosyltransferase